MNSGLIEAPVEEDLLYVFRREVLVSCDRDRRDRWLDYLGTLVNDAQPSERLRALCVLASHHSLRMEYDSANKMICEAQGVLTDSSTPDMHALWHAYQATVLTDQGSHEKALEHFELSVARAEADPTMMVLPLIFSWYGSLLGKLGRYLESDEILETAASIALAKGLFGVAAISNSAIGSNQSRRQKDGDAIHYYLKALDMYKAQGTPDRSEIYTHAGLALSYAMLANKESALKHFRQAEHIASSLQSIRTQLYLKSNLAVVYSHLNMAAERDDVTEQALQMAANAGAHDIDFQMLLNKGIHWYLNGNYEDCIPILQRAIDELDNLGQRTAVARGLHTLSLAFEQTGNIEAACKAIDRSLIIFMSTNDLPAALGMLQIYMEYYSRAGWQDVAFSRALEVLATMQSIRRSEEVERATLTESLYRNERLVRNAESYLTINRELAQANQRQRDMLLALEDVLAEKDDLLTLAAHDLKTPLAHIRTLSSVVRNSHQGLTTEDLEEIASDIFLMSDRMLTTVRHFIDFARSNRASVLQQDPADIVHIARLTVNRVRPWALKKRQTLSFVSDVEKRIIKTDSVAMEEVLDNLISNSIKYCSVGDKIAVFVKSLPHSIELSVSDTGPGLSPDELIRIFDKGAGLSPKPTGGEDSTGIGLYLTKRLVNRLGGTIDAVCPQSGGLTMTISLPIEADEQ